MSTLKLLVKAANATWGGLFRSTSLNYLANFLKPYEKCGLVDERTDGVHLSYDRMASLLAPYENPDALEVARNLDMKVEDLLRRAAA